jgi:serine/threonine protein kinase
LAVKHLLPDDADKLAKNWGAELKALTSLETCKHEHIVRFITALRLCGVDSFEYYLIFEWADGGDLKAFLNKTQRPDLTVSLMKEMCQQLCGLASALEAAHDFGENYSIRHGDLKPGNILRFENKDSIGILKFSDWGVAKEHSEVTELRQYDTTAIYGTKRYEAPEVLVPVSSTNLAAPAKSPLIKRRSRLYDVWAMGCITLEFMIWLLYGPDNVQQFIKEMPEKAPFYEVLTEKNGKKTVSVHRVAARWMDHMAKEPSCREGTALGSLLDLVQSGLLVVELPPQKGKRPSNRPAMPGQFSDRLQVEGNTAQHGIKSREIHIDKPPFEDSLGPIGDAPTFRLTRSETLKPSLSPGSEVQSAGTKRILAFEFHEGMKLIMKHEKENDRSYWFVAATRPPSPVNLNIALYSHSNNSQSQLTSNRPGDSSSLDLPEDKKVSHLSE